MQFIGDEIEAVFGAPLPLEEDHPRRAARTALEMRQRLERLNQSWPSTSAALFIYFTPW